MHETVTGQKKHDGCLGSFDPAPSLTSNSSDRNRPDVRRASTKKSWMAAKTTLLKMFLLQLFTIKRCSPILLRDHTPVKLRAPKKNRPKPKLPRSTFQLFSKFFFVRRRRRFRLRNSKMCFGRKKGFAGVISAQLPYHQSC